MCDRKYMGELPPGNLAISVSTDKIKTFLFLLMYLLFTIVSGLLFKLAWCPSSDSFLFRFIEFAFPQLCREFEYRSSYRVYFVLCIVTLVLFGLFDVFFTSKEHRREIRGHLQTSGFLLMALANASLSLTCYTLVPFLLVYLFNIIGTCFLLLSDRPALAGVMCIGNAAFIFWANFLSGIEIPAPLLTALAIMLGIAGLVITLAKSVLRAAT